MVKKLTKYSYLEPFLKTEESLHLSEISKKLKQPHPTTRIYLNYFEKLGILKKEFKGNLTIYKLNFSNKLSINFLLIAEQDKLLRKISDDLILKEVVLFFNENLDNQKALIFGSSLNNSKKAGDIDILIIGKINFNIKQLEKIINKKIHLINISNIKEIKESFKQEILKNHLILNGAEEIIKWLH